MVASTCSKPIDLPYIEGNCGCTFVRVYLCLVISKPCICWGAVLHIYSSVPASTRRQEGEARAQRFSLMHVAFSKKEAALRERAEAAEAHAERHRQVATLLHDRS